MKSILPFIFLIIAVGLFFMFINPTYSTIKTLQAEEAQFDSALEQAEAIRQKSVELQRTYDSLTEEDRHRLDAFLPERVRPIIVGYELDEIAKSFNLTYDSLDIEDVAEGGDDAALDPYVPLAVSFSVTTTYDTLLSLLRAIEQDLRVTEITEITFGEGFEESSDEESSKPGTSYKVSLEVYGLNPGSMETKQATGFAAPGTTPMAPTAQ